MDDVVARVADVWPHVTQEDLSLPVVKRQHVRIFLKQVGHLRVAKERHAPQTKPVVTVRQSVKMRQVPIVATLHVLHAWEALSK